MPDSDTSLSACQELVRRGDALTYCGYVGAVCPRHPLTAEEAADRVARQLLSELNIADIISWEDVPLINEHDFGLVVAMAQEIVRQLRPAPGHALNAYRLLESRVDNDAC